MQRIVKRLAIAALTFFAATFCFAQDANVTKQPRILHFPKDYSLGKIYIQDETAKREIETFHNSEGITEWQYLSQATGDVRIPPKKRVRLYVYPTIYRDPNKLSAIQNIGKGDLYSLVMGAGMGPADKVTDREIQYISGFTGLRELYLRGGSVTARGLNLLSGMQQLEELNAPKFIGINGMKEIVKLKSLKRLSFSENRLLNSDLDLLRELKNLEELTLSETSVTDEGLKYLADCQNLYYLSLWGDFTNEGLKYLKTLPSLKIIRLHFNKDVLTDTSLKYLSEIKGLERFGAFWMSGSIDEGIKYLSELSNFKMLSISMVKLTERGFAELGTLKNLEVLDVSSPGMNDACVQYLSQLTKLRKLQAGGSSNTPLSDTSLMYLSKLTNLEELTTSGTLFTDEGIGYLAKLKNLKQLGLMNAPQMTNAGLSGLGELKNLKNLYLFVNSKITTDGLKSLNNLDSLERLDITNVKRDSVLDIRGLKNLKYLNISSYGKNSEKCEILDEDFACLENLVKLEHLQFSRANIGDDGLNHIKGLTNLYNIFLYETEITDEGLKNFSDMKGLGSIIIGGSHITDLGLLYLQDLKSLESIEITTNQIISKKSISELRKELPSLFRCEIKTDKPKQNQTRYSTRGQ